VLLLVDASIAPQPIDLECAQWLTDAHVPFAVVFTKADKRKKKAPPVDANVSAFMQALDDLGAPAAAAPPDAFLTSAAEGSGGRDVLRHLASLRQWWLAQ
jgi:GTP-binding protein